MKKILAFITSAVMLLSLCSCGSEAVYSEAQQMKNSNAIEIGCDYYAPILSMFADDETISEIGDYTYEEVEYIFQNQYGLEIEGYPFVSALSNFRDGLETIGEIVSYDDAKVTVDGDQIIVDLSITGSKQNATAEIIVSNDMFLVLESASLNPETSFGNKMKKAGLNTLIGMGTVFLVLILIIFVISLFAYIPKIQKAMEAKKNKKTDSEEAIDNAVSQIEQNEYIDESDDLELVAVISAAIAAYEGTASADGYVVRSIKRISSKRV